MQSSNCLEAAMFAASENYSLAVYEIGECSEAGRPIIDEEFLFTERQCEEAIQLAA